MGVIRAVGEADMDIVDSEEGRSEEIATIFSMPFSLALSKAPERSSSEVRCACVSINIIYRSCPV